MKKIIILLGLLLLGFGVYSQNYKTALGIRGGIIQGFTLKHFVSGTDAFDIIIGAHHGNPNLTVLYEIHTHDIFDVPNLSLFYGFGGHVGYYEDMKISHWKHENDATVIGVSMVIGLEYTFDEIPINVGLDIKPTLNIIPKINYWQGGALYLRYTF